MTNISDFFDYFSRLFQEMGFSKDISTQLNLALNVLIVLLLVLFTEVFARRLAVKFIAKVVRTTPTKLDDHIIHNKLPQRLSRFISPVLCLIILPYLFKDYLQLQGFLERGIKVYLIIVAMFSIRSFLRSVKDSLSAEGRLQGKPLESFTQIIMILCWIVALILVFSLITNSSVTNFLAGVGALSAIVLLIFKDTILGFVTSIQVAANDIVRIGDWITVEQHHADGNVIDINLTTVRVQNFDKTITSIPAYELVAGSFTNWRGMSDSMGRRIRRSIVIQISSIRFLSHKEVEQLKSIALLKSYLEEKTEEIDAYNTSLDVDKSDLVNGRNLTNIGVFRKYAELYLLANPNINQDMTLMVRQLAPSSEGIPIEIYAFSADKVWENYEAISADIFDHLLAVVPYFNLKVFELLAQPNKVAEV